MKDFASEVRALCERVRQPTTIRLVAGLALIAPAALIGRHENKEPVALTPVHTLAPVVANVSEAALAALDSMPGPALAPGSTVAKYAKIYKISEPLALEIHKAAVEAGITPKVAFGLVRAESSFRPNVVSPVGAIGLTQLMPATARWLEPGTTRRELMQPETNLRIGFKYLNQLIDQYNGNERLALTAFNRGPGTVNKLLKRGRNPDNGYADKVITGKSARHVALMNKKFGRKTRS